jgi:hypothetical protein
MRLGTQCGSENERTYVPEPSRAASTTKRSLTDAPNSAVFHTGAADAATATGIPCLLSFRTFNRPEWDNIVRPSSIHPHRAHMMRSGATAAAAKSPRTGVFLRRKMANVPAGAAANNDDLITHDVIVHLPLARNRNALVAFHYGMTAKVSKTRKRHSAWHASREELRNMALGPPKPPLQAHASPLRRPQRPGRSPRH